MELSLAQRILNSSKPFVLFHTYKVDKESIYQAVKENKSMDLDIAIDNEGKPFIGHTLEYYEISGEVRPKNMPFYETLNFLSKAHIPLIIDCKQVETWPTLIKTLNQLGPHRCLVHIFALELKFNHNLEYDKNYPSEWIPIGNLKSLKEQFPNVTTTVSCKYLPPDVLLSSKYQAELESIKSILNENKVDTLCLNVPDETMTDKTLEFFLSENIIPHVNIDKINISSFKKTFVGETNYLEVASDCGALSY